MDDAARARRLHAAGDYSGALAHYRRALAAAPADTDLKRDLAALLLQAGHRAEAVALLRELCSTGATGGQAATMLALALRSQGDFAGARAAAAQAVAIDPRDPLALLAAGSVAAMSGDVRGAEQPLRAAVAIDPGLHEAWHWLGETLQAQQRWQDASAAYLRAMAGHPGEAVNVAICMERGGDLASAREFYLRAHAAAPERADVLVRLAQAEALACRFQESGVHAAMAADRLQSAAADDVPEAFPVSWLGLGHAATRTTLQRHSARTQARADALAPLAPPAAVVAHGGARIRIGYVSADLGRHAVGGLLRNHFAAHDRARFEVHGYALQSHDDGVATDIQAGCDTFVDCSALPADAVARRIRDDGVDVLIDLGGPTAGSRPEIFALRPCALQLGWLGFIHGQEAPWLDGVVLDHHVQPVDEPWPWSDRVLRLDTLLFPAGPMPRGRPDREGLGLPRDVPLLASFNNSYKLDAALLAAWVRILDGAPRAHLLVYLPDAAREGFLAAWARHGGDRARLHLCGSLPPARQADRAASCDLFLDAFRYQAGATGIACAAAGLPLLSCRGDQPLARLGAGLNDFLGLPELICSDATAYEECAIALANDPPALAHLRTRLAAAVEERRLLDPRRGAEAIEGLVSDLLASSGHTSRGGP